MRTHKRIMGKCQGWARVLLPWLQCSICVLSSYPKPLLVSLVTSVVPLVILFSLLDQTLWRRSQSLSPAHIVYQDNEEELVEFLIWSKFGVHFFKAQKQHENMTLKDIRWFIFWQRHYGLCCSDLLLRTVMISVPLYTNEMIILLLIICPLGP